jgi:hypothetical protein
VVQVRLSADFKGMSEADALRDLHARIAHYESIYIPVKESHRTVHALPHRVR